MDKDKKRMNSLNLCQNTIKYGEHEKTTYPSGVVPSI
jgi:hypothetical protein